MLRTAHYVTSAHRAVLQYGRQPAALTFTATDQRHLSTIADAYAAMPLVDDAALPAWHALERETYAQLGALERAGLTLETSDDDPYATPAELFADIADGRIVVLKTATTGAHPVWSDDTNDVFRAVHDVMGHAATGRGFDRHGEAAAYAHHRTMYSPLARLALASELRGQAATTAAYGTFPPNRVAILPAELHTLGLTSTATDDMCDAIVRHHAGGLTLTD